MSEDEQTPPYEVQRDPTWRKEVESWTWRPLGDGGWRKSGTCTICEHGMSVIKHGPIVFHLVEPDLADEELMRNALEGPLLLTADSGEKKQWASCNCGEKHTGRPEHIKAGCGACGWIDPPPESDDE